jgi:TP901 family phage tail tape measure protein
LDINEVMAAAKGVLQMSAAGQLGNAEAAEITANALNVFNLEGSEAVRVADLLAAAANSSSGEVRDMADALQMSASVFATAGMEIEELVAGISLMSNAGIQGSDAGTSLKQMLLSLQAPSKNAKALMNELGINIYDASGKMLDMRSIIDIFSTQMSGLTQEQRNFALATIFGSDAVRAANIVLMGGVEAYDTMLGKVTEVGAASKLASALMEGLTGSMENLKSAFETAAIAAIEPLKDDLKVLIDFAVKLLNAFADLPEPVREGIVKLILFAAVLGPILILLGNLLPMLGGGVSKSLNPFNGGIVNLVKSFIWLVGVAAFVVKVLGFFGISTGAVGVKILALQSIISGVGWSILGFLGQILLLAAGPVLLYWAFKTNFMGIATTAEQLWFIIKYAFSEGWKWLVTAVKGGAAIVVNWFKDMINKIVQAFRGLRWSDIGKFIIQGIATGLLGGIPALVAAAMKVAEAVQNAFDRKMDINSPSGWFEKRGEYSWMGYMKGWGKMDAGAISKALAKPVVQQASGMQNNNSLYFSSGLTLRDVDRLSNQKFERYTRELNAALGG